MTRVSPHYRFYPAEGKSTEDTNVAGQEPTARCLICKKLFMNRDRLRSHLKETKECQKNNDDKAEV